MAKGKRKKPRTVRPPQRAEGARRARPREPVAEAPRRSGSVPTAVTVARRVVAVALMAALGVSLAAYFIPRPRWPNEESSAWQRMQAPRVWQTVRLWGMSRDEKRLRAPEEWMGGRVFSFTQFWGTYLDKRLMPMTKFNDWTRDEHIAYLLPGTGRPAPLGADARPPVIVGYGLRQSRLAPTLLTRPTVLWEDNTPVDRIVLDEGVAVGQSFITVSDFDCINAVAVLGPTDNREPLPEGMYTGVVYSALNRRHVLAQTAGLTTDPEEGRQQLVFTFDPPLRLKHHRGSTPYLFEMTWKRPSGYAGPAPVFPVYGGSALVVSDLYIDGNRQADRDLGFMVRATHTDLTGYTMEFSREVRTADGEKQLYFFAVRDDVYERVGGLSSKPTPAELSKLFDRLNKVLLEL